VIAALRRAYLRQRIRWAENDLAWVENDRKLLPAKEALTRGALSALRTKLAMLEPPGYRPRPESAVVRQLRARAPLALVIAAFLTLLAVWPARASSEELWRAVEGTDFAYRPSSLWLTAQMSFVVRREDKVYRFQIDGSACSARKGLARLYANSGELLVQAPFLLGGSGNTSTLARALCAARDRSMT
jgi:hypothetical protein